MENIETCCICYDKTGKSGSSDDSLFYELMQPFPILELVIGDEVGPCCKRCFDALIQLGFIDAWN